MGCQVLSGVQDDRGWRRLVEEVLGRPDRSDHPLFATDMARVQHRAECDAGVAEQTRRWSTEDLDRRVSGVGIPAAQINGMAGLVAPPQLSERGRWRVVGTESGQVQAVLPPMTCRDVELRMADVPSLGQQTDQFLTELGLSPEHRAHLQRDGVVQQHASTTGG